MKLALKGIKLLMPVQYKIPEYSVCFRMYPFIVYKGLENKTIQCHISNVLQCYCKYKVDSISSHISYFLCLTK